MILILEYTSTQLGFLRGNSDHVEIVQVDLKHFENTAGGIERREISLSAGLTKFYPTH